MLKPILENYPLILLPAAALAAAFLWYLHWRKTVTSKLGDRELVQGLLAGYSHRQLMLQFFLLLLAMCCLATAILAPRPAIEEAKAQLKSPRVVFFLDVSLSMLAEDVPPNRLEKAKYIISKTIEGFTSEKVSLVLFSGIAYPLIPLTQDYESVQHALPAIKADMLPVPGSDIRQALEMARIMKEGNQDSSYFFFLLTDGENHTADLAAKIDSTRQSGISIHTIGIGTSAGATIPEKKQHSGGALSAAAGGRFIKTSLNEETLRLLAQGTGGRYWPVLHTNTTVNFISQAISSSDPQPGIPVSTPDRPVFQWFLGISALLLIAEFLFVNP